MTDKEKFREEIENRFNICLKRAKIVDADYWNAKADAYRNVLLAFDDLPKESASEDLEEAAMATYPIRHKENKNGTGEYDSNLPRRKAFIAGANWQREQMISKTCEWLEGLNDSHEIMSYTDSHTVETDELIQYFKNFMED